MLVPSTPWWCCTQRTWFFPCVSAALPVAPSSAVASVLRSHSYLRPVPVGVGSTDTQLKFDPWWGLRWRGAAPPLNLSSCSATLHSKKKKKSWVIIHEERNPFKTGEREWGSKFHLPNHIWPGARGRQVGTEGEENEQRRLDDDVTETGGHNRSPSNAGNPFGLRLWP